MLKLLRTLKAFKFQVALVFLFVFLQTLSDLYLPKLMSHIIDKGVVTGDKDYIWRIGGIMLLVAAGGLVCTVLVSFLSAKVSAGFGRNTRKQVFTHVENFSLQEFDKIGTASLITRTTNDITQVQNVLVMMLRMMIWAPFMAIGGIFMAVNQDAELSWVFVGVIPVIALLIFGIMKKGVPFFKAMQVKLDRLNQVVREQLMGIRVIRSFNRSDFEKKRFNKANLDLTDTAVKVNRIMAFMMPAMMLIMNVAIVAIVWFGSIRIDNMAMDLGDLMAFIQYAMQIMMALVMVSFMFVLVPRASVSAVRINEVLDMKPVIKNSINTKLANQQRGMVEFKDVTFSYPGAEIPALSHISFIAKQGQTTAIIGGTGSGKTTMLSLIPRFYDITGGSILVDGIDIREQSQESLREKIGYVPQKAVLFSGTIADNIRYGKENATDEEIRHAAEIAQATDFILVKEEGYESQISQGGTNVSGGQKQRLSIARALVRKPEIYLFDDSFSALDLKTDAKLRAALKGETTDSTVIIVAQRVSTVMNADQIIVLEDGEISGIGTHKDLLKNSEVYREIVSSQMSEEESA
ncbi:ABC transporter ATP-binding protein [Bacillus sp. 1NLA3E]|uniref:ABC transporter ATP-binding protein n=1 Tax=Bacillus sp. 1NLA3E TaxID=666686 RepID=UPI000247EA64|nr:ABC transporter ATP-binding protein [Bacillus sp. 1NLA3E]AGK52421.1 ABC transporter-like protein [Bacillus sp. 1NLA3E]